MKVHSSLPSAHSSEGTQRLRAVKDPREFLWEAGRTLASSLDYEEALREVVRVSVPVLADWCALDLLEAEGTLRRVEVAHRDPDKRAFAIELHRRYPPSPSDLHGPFQVLRTGLSELIAEIPDALLVASARDPEHLRIARELRLGSVIIVPLQARGRVLGTLTLATESTRAAFGASDLATAEELARSAALAIDTARLLGERQTLIDALRQNKERLERSEERLRIALEAVELGAWEHLPATGALDFDARSNMLMGYPPDTRMTFERFVAALHPEDRDATLKGIQHAVDPASGGSCTLEYRTCGPDGVPRQVRAVGRGFFEGDRCTRFVGTLQDVTHTRQVEEEARRRIEMERQLIGIVSHDLRNPVGAIQMAASLLQRRGGLDEAQARSVSRVMSSALRAGRLIGDFLDYAQARNARIPIHRAPANLHDVCRTAADEVHLSHRDRQLTVRRSGDGSGQWDNDRLAQVVGNLLRNAFQHGPEGTPVELETIGEAEEVVIHVRNGDPPIPEDIRERLFQPYERGKDARAGSGRSVGLGLFIAREIVSAHGGRVECRSSAGEGTVFTVRLPRNA